jgi:endonuclease YncB( thermonuclease family)
MPLAPIEQGARQQTKTLKGVLYAVPFFCLLAFTQNANARCSSNFYDDTVVVASVHDGDTLRLQDGRKLRIIGINTPELARKKKPAEPFAHQARVALEEILKSNRQIKLRYGKEKYDRYNRLLAHPFLINGENITEHLLKQGMGFSIVVPPNIWQADCYKNAEKYARNNNIGLWQHPRYLPLDVSKITKKLRGYHRVTGTVQRIGESRYSYWLNLSKEFALRIKKQDAKHFSSLPIHNLEGKTLIARGWIYERNNEMRMRISHPSALEVVN